MEGYGMGASMAKMRMQNVEEHAKSLSVATSIIVAAHTTRTRVRRKLRHGRRDMAISCVKPFEDARA